MPKRYICTSIEFFVLRKKCCKQPTLTVLTHCPLVPKARYIECQNLPFPKNTLPSLSAGCQSRRHRRAPRRRGPSGPATEDVAGAGATGDRRAGALLLPPPPPLVLKKEAAEEEEETEEGEVEEEEKAVATGPAGPPPVTHTPPPVQPRRGKKLYFLYYYYIYIINFRGFVYCF